MHTSCLHSKKKEEKEKKKGVMMMGRQKAAEAKEGMINKYPGKDIF